MNTLTANRPPNATDQWMTAKTGFRTTAQDWLDVPVSNPVAMAMTTARWAAERIVSGNSHKNGLIMVGPPGIGKSKLLLDMVADWKARGLTPIKAQPNSAADLVKNFREAEGVNPIYVEEADLIFESRKMANLIKDATDPTRSARVLTVALTKAEMKELADEDGVYDGPRFETISLDVPLVVSTNKRLDLDNGPKDLLAHRRAIKDRTHFIAIPDDDPLAVWEFICWLALSTPMLDRKPTGDDDSTPDELISLAARHQALDWFTQNLWVLDTISARTLIDATYLFHDHRQPDPKSPSGLRLDAVGLRTGLSLLLGNATSTARVPVTPDWSALRKAVVPPKAKAPAKQAERRKHRPSAPAPKPTVVLVPVAAPASVTAPAEDGPPWQEPAPYTAADAAAYAAVKQAAQQDLTIVKAFKDSRGDRQRLNDFERGCILKVAGQGGWTNEGLADLFGVSSSTIHRILTAPDKD